MSLPALAELADLAARIPGGIEEDDEPRAQAALDDASALIRAEAGDDWVTDGDPPALDTDNLPDVAVTVCLAAARRAFVNPDGVTQESLDGYSTSYRNDSADVYLTKAERRLISQAGGRTGIGVMPTTRTSTAPDVPYVHLDTEYTDGATPTEPIPWDVPEPS